MTDKIHNFFLLLGDKLEAAARAEFEELRGDIERFRDLEAEYRASHKALVSALETIVLARNHEVAELKQEIQRLKAQIPRKPTVEAIPILDELPCPAIYTGPNLVLLNTDGRLYLHKDMLWQPVTQ